MCLPACDRLLEQLGAQLRGRGVEEQRVVLVPSASSRSVVQRVDAVRLGERCELVGVAADQDRIGHHAVAVRQRDAALLADRARSSGPGAGSCPCAR